jgi:hypothetical protein
VTLGRIKVSAVSLAVWASAAPRGPHVYGGPLQPCEPTCGCVTAAQGAFVHVKWLRWILLMIEQYDHSAFLEKLHKGGAMLRGVA